MNTSTSNRGVISFLAIIAITACLSRQLMARAAEDKCIKDYTQPCAEGWAESSVLARVCEAPISYYGPCATNVAFMDTKEDKIKLEEMCHIKWPCFSYCREDDLTGCPKFWYLEDGFCKPSAGYHGRCSEPADLTKMHETERTLWGNRCGVQWPCKTKCKNNYKAKCPEGWQPTGTK
ncbi:cpw-wpc domain-containing, putative [Babesia ovis]|uniref:Cpw-wpc domain-containing, putative n=1 Tax=Babesia ovis TaxID=5869 RepID=A0A9W5TB23_BABOV|nr:cpw-wpc domain-containing, putative [Babesia ovis]